MLDRLNVFSWYAVIACTTTPHHTTQTVQGIEYCQRMVGLTERRLDKALDVLAELNNRVFGETRNAVLLNKPFPHPSLSILPHLSFPILFLPYLIPSLCRFLFSAAPSAGRTCQAARVNMMGIARIESYLMSPAFGYQQNELYQQVRRSASLKEKVNMTDPRLG